MLTIREGSPAEHDAVHDIFSACFAEDRWPAVRERVLDGRARLVVAVDALAPEGPGEVVGFAVSVDLGDNITQLTHIAVHPNARSRGVGSLLVADAWATAKADGANWLLFEVEWPREDTAPADLATDSHVWTGDPIRRWNFFASRGALLVSHHYTLPLATGEVEQVMLLGFPLRRQTGVAEPAAVGDWVGALWGPNGHNVPEDDPRLAWAIEQVSQPA